MKRAASSIHSRSEGLLALRSGNFPIEGHAARDQQVLRAIRRRSD